MRNALLLTALLTSLAAAAQPPGPPPHGGPGGPRGPEFLLPPDWWHDTNFTSAAKLTSDQVQKLDKLQSAQRDELAKLERDLTNATRDMRTALDRNEQIVAAGNRFAALRDQLLRKQIALLAAQRALLTQAQWSALQKQFESHRPQPRDR